MPCSAGAAVPGQAGRSAGTQARVDQSGVPGGVGEAWTGFLADVDVDVAGAAESGGELVGDGPDRRAQPVAHRGADGVAVLCRAAADDGEPGPGPQHARV